MRPPATDLVGPFQPWLSQGDIFQSVMIVRAGISNAVVVQAVERGPAILVSHGCAIDKKNKDGSLKTEYLSFLPLQSAQLLQPDPLATLRANRQGPYEALYLGEVPQIGESYAMLTQPYTLPIALFQPVLRTFTAEETGSEEDQRVTLTQHATRVASLTEPQLELLLTKWSIQWTRQAPDD